MKIIKLDNVIYNVDVVDYRSNYVKYNGDDETGNLGLCINTYPKELIVKMIEEECWETEYDEKIIPYHYGYESIYQLAKSSFETVNPDTQIVLANFAKNYFKKRVQVNVITPDPWWIFHDYFHAENDCHFTEVCCINSFVEHRRLIEADELARNYKIRMLPETALNLYNSWHSRWKIESVNSKELKIEEVFNFVAKKNHRELENLLQWM